MKKKQLEITLSFFDSNGKENFVTWSNSTLKLKEGKINLNFIINGDIIEIFPDLKFIIRNDI